MAYKSKNSGFVNGIHFDNRKQCAEYFGLSIKAFVNRKEMSLQDAYNDIQISKSKKSIAFEHNGIKFKSIKHFCKYYGKHRDAIFDLQRKGYSFEAALDRAVLNARAEFTKISQCQDCNKFYAKNTLKRGFCELCLSMKSAPFTHVSSCVDCGVIVKKELKKHTLCKKCDEIRNLNSLEIIKKHRKIRREKEKQLGIRTRDRSRKRHQKHGAVYDRTVSAKSVALKFGMICQICLERVEPHLGKGYQPKGWTVGHLIPVSMGGSQTWGNVQCECSDCNTAKGAAVISNEQARELFVLKKAA